MRALLAAILTAAATAATAASWQTYRNDRFGTTADVPAGWRMGPEPGNSDGRVFASPDGAAEIRIFGGYSVLSQDEEFGVRLRPSPGETIDYRRRGRDWLVASGRKGDRIFYRKSLLSCGAKVWNSVYLDYPAARRQAFDPIVAHVAASLRGGRGVDDCR
ncbi:hypothetical protein [Methylocystis sp. S23]|jgi:hypothetical protein